MRALLVIALFVVGALIAAAGCATTSHAVLPAKLGVVRSSAELEAVIDTPGTLEVNTVSSAEWQIARSGLVNLDHPTARAAKLEDGDEPITLYFHAIRHPTRGLFIIDTGVETAWSVDPKMAKPWGIVATVAQIDRMRPRMPLGTWLQSQSAPLVGVLYTHLHVDHVLGTPDVPATATLYAGPGDARSHAALHAATQGPIDRCLEGHGPIEELPFEKDPTGTFDGVLDVFGDGELWAIHVPGHTPGSVAYVARTPVGPVLFTGDTSHTAWGWNNGVEPGTFTVDHDKNRENLLRLKALVARHPTMRVRLGHQPLD